MHLQVRIARILLQKQMLLELNVFTTLYVIFSEYDMPKLVIGFASVDTDYDGHLRVKCAFHNSLSVGTAKQ